MNRYFLVFYSASLPNGSINGVLSVINPNNKYVNNKWVNNEIKTLNPEFSSCVTRNILELSETDFLEWHSIDKDDDNENK